jgi:hypothetical protein
MKIHEICSPPPPSAASIASGGMNACTLQPRHPHCNPAKGKHMTSTVTSLVIGALAAACFGAHAAEPVSSAQALLEKSCETCHAQVFAGKVDAVYTRSNRRVNTMQVLIDQVKLWNSAAAAKWSDADIELVARYLNEKYYQF